jgi:hypothetical protein
MKNIEQPIEGASEKNIVLLKPRMHDTFNKNMREKPMPPKKGIGAPYRRQDSKRIEITAAKVVMAYLSSED